MAFIPEDQLRAMGFRLLGRNVLISEKASIYRPEVISIGDHSRIDDFCILSAGSGGISIGRYVHVACHSTLIGQGRITMEDYSCVSSRVSVYSSSDDFSGAAMTNSTVPDQFKNVRSAPVRIGKHALVGSGAVILPGVQLGEGAVLGALSLAKGDCQAFMIYAGCPARVIGRRRRDLLDCEHAFVEQQAIKPGDGL